MVTSVIWIITFGISLLLAGIVASFSIVLYAALFTALSGARRPLRNGLLLMTGLTSSLLLLAFLFMVTQPEVFSMQEVMTRIGGVRTNSVDAILGLLCLLGGMALLYRKQVSKGVYEVDRPEDIKPLKMRAGGAALASLGFVRGLTRVTGVAALLFAVRMILHTVEQFTFQLLWVVVLISLSMVPYASIFALRLWRPAVFRRSQKILHRIIASRPQRYTGEVLVGVGVLFLGLSLV